MFDGGRFIFPPRGVAVSNEEEEAGRFLSDATERSKKMDGMMMEVEKRVFSPKESLKMEVKTFLKKRGFFENGKWRIF